MKYTILAVVLASAVPAVAEAKSAQKEFSQAWEDRDQRYVTSTQSALSASQSAWEAFASNTDPDQTFPKLKAAFDATYQARYHEGRQHFLRDFRIHMSSKPSRQLTDLWMQERIEQIRLSSEGAQRQFATLSQIKFTDTDKVKTYISGSEQAIIESGHAHGAIDELKLLNQNLAVYYQAKDAEEVRNSQRRAAIADALGAGLTNMSNQYYAASQRNWSARCTTYGNTTNCSGN